LATSGVDDSSFNSSVNLYNFPNGTLLKSWVEDSLYGGVYALAFSPDGQFLATGTGSALIKIWNLPEGTLWKTIGLEDMVNTFVLDPSGQFIAVIFLNGTLAIYSWPECRLIRKFIDIDSTTSSVSVIEYVDADGITRLVPAGTVLQAGVVCTCNTIGGTYSGGGGGGGGGGGCSCNLVCTCVPVYSDRNAKENFSLVDVTSLLEQVASIPIQSWNYKEEGETVRHIGPMAQDFAEQFKVGTDARHICNVDAHGVAYAAIQGLYQLLKEKERQIESQQEQIDALRSELNLQKERSQALAQAINQGQIGLVQKPACET
jgi:hypothetical protein